MDGSADALSQATPAELVASAAAGDERAWSRLVDRYSPLILAVIRACRLNRVDAADAYQTVWLRLLEHLGRLRDPTALPRWLVVTTRRECYRLLRTERLSRPFDPHDEAAPGAAALLVDTTPIDEELLRAERRQALREAFAQLPARCQHLLRLLLADPPARYQQISEQLGMPVGSVGPTQGRCLRKLRAYPAVAAFAADPPAIGEEDHDGVAAVG